MIKENRVLLSNSWFCERALQPVPTLLTSVRHAHILYPHACNWQIDTGYLLVQEKTHTYTRSHMEKPHLLIEFCSRMKKSFPGADVRQIEIDCGLVHAAAVLGIIGPPTTHTHTNQSSHRSIRTQALIFTCITAIGSSFLLQLVHWSFLLGALHSNSSQLHFSPFAFT